MSAAESFAATTAAVDDIVRYLAGLASARDHLCREFDGALAVVQAAHLIGQASDALPRLEELLARLGDVEALTAGALSQLENLLSETGGHGVR